MPAPVARPPETAFLPEEVFEAIELPKRKGIREALRAICSTPGIGTADLQKRLGMQPIPTGGCVKGLLRKGLIEVRLAYIDGKEQRLHYVAGNLAGMLRAKAARFVKAADALDGKAA